MQKRNTRFLTMMIALALILAIPALCISQNVWGNFGYTDKGDAKNFFVKIPKIEPTAEEWQTLYEGGYITRMLDSPNGFKSGYLRFFAPFDPVTTYMIANDVKNFATVDPAFPKTKGRRSFMPYTYDCATCTDEGKPRMYQLLVLPFVDPRKLCIDRMHNTTAFPWESAWKLVPGRVCCQDKANPEMKEYADEAVIIEKNVGAWHISPLPKKFRKTEADLMRTDCIYYVDTNPGGNLAKLGPLVNMAQSQALPKVRDNVVFHGKRWEKHLQKYYGPGLVAKYNQWKADYLAAVKEQ